MFKSLKDFFEERLKPGLIEKEDQIAEHAIRLACSALLIELARSDFEFELSERIALERTLQRVYGITTEETAELMVMAESQADASVSLDQFTLLLDRNLNPAQKLHFLELLWELAYVDGRIDKYEEYLIRKLSDLLHVPHSGFIQAKLNVQRNHQPK